MRWIVIFCSMIISASLSLLANPQQGNVFQGTWKLNLKQSELNVTPPQSQVVQINIIGDQVHMEQTIVSEKGEHLLIAATAKFDGKDYPVSGTPFADTVSYRLINSNTIEGKAKKSGKVVVTEIAVLSADGRSLKVTYYSKNASGQDVTSTAVFYKQ